jgi:hypothetical protein
MIGCYRRIFFAFGVASVAACFGLARAAQDELPVGPDPEALRKAVEQARGTFHGPGEPKPAEMEAFRTRLRALYPYTSLAPRLSYESAVGKRTDVRGGPGLGEEGREDLADLEAALGASSFRGRVPALELLHRQSLQEFIEASGFGMRRVGRMPIVQGYDITPREIPFEKTTADWSEGDIGVPTELPKVGGAGDSLNRDALRSLHRRGLADFTNPDSWGLVRDREKAAGFLPHHFRELPSLVEKRNDSAGQVVKPAAVRERWALSRLELVSLLTHETPVVYVSEHLPSMRELKKSETRELHPHEEESLKALAKGENLVVEATTNRVRMVGGIRAAGQCLKCHEGKRGELLGAFSYELRRDPPVKPVD